MATARDVALARLALAAFNNAAPALPPGFSPVPAADLGLSIGPGESYADGVYRNQNAAALVVSGTLNGVPSLVLSFRGGDDREDSVNILRDINADYPDFAELVAAVDGLAVRGGVGQVAVTGHSLGGSLTQLYMAEHPAEAGGVPRIADTLGSPGALLADGPDPRITNYAVADDPAVFLGENRAAVGAELQANPFLAGAAAAVAAAVFPGLTVTDALDAVASADTDYENRGTTVLFPGADGTTEGFGDVNDLVWADPERHRGELYVGFIAAEAAGATGRGAEVLFDRAFYLARNPDVAAAGVDAQLHYDQFGWREGRDPEAAFSTGFSLSRNPDVAAAGVNPLLHYAVSGWREGRDPNPFFDTDLYLAQNPDVAAARVDPLLHYEVFGWMEGRDPGPGFDTDAYLARYPDVALAGVNPLEHYLTFGIAEGRLL
jgi:pimeloyl-ACP methyl ester carboxylesterase